MERKSRKSVSAKKWTDCDFRRKKPISFNKQIFTNLHQHSTLSSLTIFHLKKTQRKNQKSLLASPKNLTILILLLISGCIVNSIKIVTSCLVFERPIHWSELQRIEKQFYRPSLVLIVQLLIYGAATEPSGAWCRVGTEWTGMFAVQPVRPDMVQKLGG